MGRNPKLRVNFDSDVQYLLRLKHAIEEDDGYPPEFKQEAVSQIVKLQRLFMDAPPRKEAETTKAS